MLVEARFHHLAQQIAHLVECSSVHLFLGCSEPELRHPLLNLYATNSYWSIGQSGSPDARALLQEERIRALCDSALQTGQVQSIDHFQPYAENASVQSIAIAHLERPAGILGFLLLTDWRPFYHGERLLLGHYLPQVAQNLEKDLEKNLRTLKQITQAHEHQQQTELDLFKNEFISLVSHELRTPVTAIKGYAVLLQAYGINRASSVGLADHADENSGESMSPIRQREYLNSIMEQTGHLEVLISDLLDISRIHAGRLPLRCSQLDIVSLCRRVIQHLQQRIDQQDSGQYSISCHLPTDLPLAWADPNRVQQVLSNLLENAVKYSPNGGLIEVVASPCSTERDAAMISITVRDRGIGIPSEQHIRLFQPFTRLEHPLTNDTPGVGLGLYISRKLVEAMGGSITLSSSPDHGTSVTFTLPVYCAEKVQNSNDWGLAKYSRVCYSVLNNSQSAR